MASVIGNLHVRPIDHNADFQQDLLLRHSAHRTFADIAGNASNGGRAELAAALDAAEAGDTLLVWRLDRLGGAVGSVLHDLGVMSMIAAGERALLRACLPYECASDGSRLCGEHSASLRVESRAAGERMYSIASIPAPITPASGPTFAGAMVRCWVARGIDRE